MIHRTPRTLFLTLATIVLTVVPTMAGERAKHHFGVKGGVLASIPYDIFIQSDQFEATAIENIGRVGTALSAAWLIELDKFFVQPELSYIFSQGAARFFLVDESAVHPAEQQIDYRYQMMSLPVQLGYNLVKDNYYSLGFYLAPQIDYRIKAQYVFNDNAAESSFGPWGVHAGFGVNIIIDDITMDMRYAFAPFEHSVTLTPERSENHHHECSISQRNNMLSIVVGYYF